MLTSWSGRLLCQGLHLHSLCLLVGSWWNGPVWDFWNTLFTVLRNVSACSMLSGLMAVSSFTIISVARMLVGIMVKFSPFLSRVVSALLSVLEDRLTTQFVWSTLGVEVDLQKEELLKFLFRRCLVLLKTRWVLVLIFSSRLFTSSERVIWYFFLWIRLPSHLLWLSLSVVFIPSEITRTLVLWLFRCLWWVLVRELVGLLGWFDS